MKVGGCSFAFGPNSLQDAAQILKRFGFAVVDLGVCSTENTQLDPVLTAEGPQKWADHVLRILSDGELELNECFTLDFGDPVNHPDPAVRSRTTRLFQGLVSFAQRIGCRSVMLIPGIVHPELGWERSFDLAVRELSALSKIATEEGIRLNIEACEPSVAEKPQDANRLCQEVPELGLTLDYSHFIDPGHSQDEVEILHQHARNVHIRQAAPGKRVACVDNGTIDFERVVSLLRKENYEGVLAVEYVDCPQTTACGVDVLTETPKMKRELERLLEL